jgi:hypothetical protein
VPLELLSVGAVGFEDPPGPGEEQLLLRSDENLLDGELLSSRRKLEVLQLGKVAVVEL